MKILIMDDEQAIRDALGRKLRREGFEVFLCAEGIEALRTFHTVFALFIPKDPI